MTFSDARSYCQDLGQNGDLASLSTIEQIDFVTNNFGFFNGLIGGKKIGENTWEWVDGNSISETQWDFREPKSLDVSEVCIVMNNKENFGRWTAVECGKKLEFLCQILR